MKDYFQGQKAQLFSKFPLLSDYSSPLFFNKTSLALYFA